MKRLAMLGFGRIGRIHARALVHPDVDAQLAAVADPSPGALQLAEAHGAQAFTDVDALLDACDDLDAVLVCSSTPDHVTHTTRALEAGLHVLCEKPLSENLDDIRALGALAREQGRVLRVGFNRRFDPKIDDLRAATRGRVGVVRSGLLISRDPTPPPPGYPRSPGSMLRDCTIHDFDTVRFLTGDEAVAVTCRGRGSFDQDALAAGDVDTIFTILEMSSGALISIDNCRATSYGFDQRLEIHGQLGTAQVANESAPQAVHFGQDGVLAPPLLDFFPERFAASYVRQLQHFTHAIDTGANTSETARPNGADAFDALQSLRYAHAAFLSLREGRTVQLSEV